MEEVAEQFRLFPETSLQPEMPEGLIYSADVISPPQEQTVTDAILSLPLQPFAFHGFFGLRRVISFGWRYDHNGGGLQRAEPIPAFLMNLREKAAEVAGLRSMMLEHVLLTEYRPGAGIGWHRDKPEFDTVIALSLLSPCRLRFRRREGDAWRRIALKPAPRSAYVLAGPARDIWQHSIPPVDVLRYSITFRTLRASGGDGEIQI